MNEKALIIDEDAGLLALLRSGLEEDGFRVITVDDGQEALRTAFETSPDIIVLDVAMENTDGWGVCRQLRYMCDAPIVVLSASAGEAHIIKALATGADEYLTKPRGLQELRARIRAILRRERMSRNRGWQPIYEDQDLRIDLVNGSVTRGSEIVHLTPTESRLLMCLVNGRGRVVPHQELLINVWGQDSAKAIDSLSVYIRYLREKVEEDPSNPRYIRTHWGIGYYFAPQQREIQ